MSICFEASEKFFVSERIVLVWISSFDYINVQTKNSNPKHYDATFNVLCW